MKSLNDNNIVSIESGEGCLQMPDEEDEEEEGQNQPCSATLVYNLDSN